MIKNSLCILISLLTFSLQALEVETKDFFSCLQKTATTIESRTVRIHQFLDENKCAVVYSVEGQDKVISHGSWLSFCESTAAKVVANLQKGLWKCEGQKNQVKVFYSFVPLPK